MNILDEFKKYMIYKEYEIDIISQTSIRGIKDKFKVHLYFDADEEEYILNVTNNGYKLYNTIFIETESGYKLNHENEEILLFSNIEDIINYTNNNIEIKI
ncbi:hypothetical protein K2F43_00815 [Clostridium estertheticum]|uniref:hypothetical protein n=1 Tax=Clostridium estertheticum TaxID=238834 RepID=UPI001C6E5403|nr:hypothetical protein [Clostridium estertheticum]MBW9169742.1 hypothetical protein [Clostridium estertheticum]WLC74751.1 hypothetical protein KTC99_18650 [Clostridium estertheticum]